MHRSSYRVARIAEGFVWIIDQDGPLSVTNDAEAVVADLFKTYGDRRIIYRDTQGDWDELVHESGRFKSFAQARMFGLPDHVLDEPIKTCDRCGKLLDDDSGPRLCASCGELLARQQDEDDRLDDPRHGQAKGINRRIE